MSTRRDEYDDDGDTVRWLIGIVVVGALLYSCHEAPHGGPPEHKCWTEVGYEKC